MSLETFQFGQDLLRLVRQYHDVFGTLVERGSVHPDLLGVVQGGMCIDQPVNPRGPVVLMQQAVDERGEFHHTQRQD